MGSICETKDNYSYLVKGVPDLLGTESVMDLLPLCWTKQKQQPKDLRDSMHTKPFHYRWLEASSN